MVRVTSLLRGMVRKVALGCKRLVFVTWLSGSPIFVLQLQIFKGSFHLKPTYIHTPCVVILTVFGGELYIGFRRPCAKNFGWEMSELCYGIFAVFLET